MELLRCGEGVMDFFCGIATDSTRKYMQTDKAQEVTRATVELWRKHCTLVVITAVSFGGIIRHAVVEDCRPSGLNSYVPGYILRSRFV